MRTLRIAFQATLVTLVVTGLVYPMVMTALASALFRDQARGTVVRDVGGQPVGSHLIGQRFTLPAYFQGRPSAAGEGYDAKASGGSNLGPTSAKLRQRVQADVAHLQKENPDAPGPIPGDLVTASASGLDPHISPAAAIWQLARVARARAVAPERIRALIADITERRQLGLLGEPRVNVLALNLALDRLLGKPVTRAASPASPVNR